MPLGNDPNAGPAAPREGLVDKRALHVFAAVLLPVAALVALVPWGSMGHLLVGGAMVVALLAGAPLALVLGVVAWIQSRRGGGTHGQTAATLAAVLAISVGAAFLTFFAGSILETRRQVSAMGWVEEQLPRLARYRFEHGHYPAGLSEVCDLSEAPILVRMGDLTYRVRESSYVFDLSTGWLSGFSWSSDAGRWEHYD